MTDDLKPPPAPLEPITDPTAAPEKRTVAMHTDELWGGAKQIEGLPGMPTIDTKSAYWRQLAAAGLRMKDQQESVPPEFAVPPPVEPALPVVFAEVRVPPLRMDEAHIYGAVTAVFRRFDLVETVWCEDCFARGRHHGVRLVVADDGVLIHCRCGSAHYKPPVGTTDLVLRQLPTIATVSGDTTRGTVTTALGIREQPTVILHDLEAAILRRYLSALQRRHKDPRLFHTACWSGDVQEVDAALAMAAAPDRLVLVCQCRTLYHQDSRVISPAPLKVM